MANQSYQQSLIIKVGETTNVWPTLIHQDVSVSSPKKPSGGLALRPNPHVWDHRWSTVPLLSSGSGDKPFVPLSAMGMLSQYYYGDIASRDLVVDLTNEALARFTGKVRKHNASLGVTVASWKQSANMIRDRTHKLGNVFEKRAIELEKLVKKRKSGRVPNRQRVQATASNVLEGMFGWAPLITDIQDGLGTLARDPAESRWVRASANATAPWRWSTWGQPGMQTWISQDAVERYLVTVSGQAVITSQNTFLANRLGLLNLPGVAWDLVPWSFVVNMVSNAAQMVNSLTDFAGVDIQRSSTTKSVRTHIRQQCTGETSLPANLRAYQGFASSELFIVYRSRTLGLPTPKFMWRVPELNLGLVAIGASLMLQKLNRLNRAAAMVFRGFNAKGDTT